VFASGQFSGAHICFLFISFLYLAAGILTRRHVLDTQSCCSIGRHSSRAGRRRRARPQAQGKKKLEPRFSRAPCLSLGGAPCLSLQARTRPSTLSLSRPLSQKQNPAYADVFATANKYHLAHSALLAAAPLARRPAPVAALAASGTALFCGSCYAAAVTEDRAWGRGAPVGGVLLIGAWAALALPL